MILREFNICYDAMLYHIPYHIMLDNTIGSDKTRIDSIVLTTLCYNVSYTMLKCSIVSCRIAWYGRVQYSNMEYGFMAWYDVSTEEPIVVQCSQA